MNKPAYLTAPLKTEKMPPGIPYIIGNEAAERFSFYGMRAILVIFMTQYLRDSSGELATMSENEANRWYHLFLSLNYFLPVFGALLADIFWGKYKTIFWLSLVYCAGHLALALDETRFGLTLGLTLIAIGSGGIKPCVSANVGDQFGPSNQHLLSKAFGWFYFAINAGSLISIPLTPVLLEKVGPAWAFGLPGILMFLATAIFWAGRRKFAHIPPAGWASFRENFRGDGLSAIKNIAIVYVFVAIFWALWDQSGSEWVLQAEKMDRQFTLFGIEIELLAAQIQTLNSLFILLMIVGCNYVVYPLIERVYRLNELRKIGLGFVVTALSFVIIAWIETQISNGVRPSIVWQVPAYLLLSTGEVMVSVTALEFAYTQAPKRMKSIVMVLYLLPISAGNFITAGVHWVIENPDGSSKLAGASFYSFFIALCLVTALVYALVARSYRGKTYIQDEAPAAPAS